MSMFEIVAILTFFSAIMVLSVKNPVHSVLYLIFVFCNATGLLIFLNVEFFALLLLTVYVGAIAILFLFVVMMLNIKLVEIKENQMKYLPIGGIIASVFLIELYMILEPINLGVVNYINWDETYRYLSNIKVIGQVLYTDYAILFLIAGLILLVGMIGAIVLTLGVV